jgi:hypothetical protein
MSKLTTGALRILTELALAIDTHDIPSTTGAAATWPPPPSSTTQPGPG